MPSYTRREWGYAAPWRRGRAPFQHTLLAGWLPDQDPPLAGRGGGGALEDRRHELRARGVVGVIAAQGCSFRKILPKIDVSASRRGERQNAAIRKRLVHMLAVALDLNIEIGRITDLDWQRDPLLEILIRIFCDKLTEAIRRGMPRRYLDHEDDLSALRGTLDVPRQFYSSCLEPRTPLLSLR